MKDRDNVMSKNETKNALQKSAAPVDEVNAIDDNDLEDVAGGWTNIFNCPKEYNLALCEWTFCPHIKTRENTPDEDHYDKYCDLGYWSDNLSYPQKN